MLANDRAETGPGSQAVLVNTVKGNLDGGLIMPFDPWQGNSLLARQSAKELGGQSSKTALDIQVKRNLFGILVLGLV